MPRWGLSLRAGALLACGGLALHELRYWAGYHEHAEDALARHGHGYVALVEAAVAALAVVACVAFAARLLRAARTGERESAGAPFLRCWANATAALSGMYVAQEWIEGQLFAGHPTGLAGIVGHGGWSAFVLAVALGAVIALLLRGAKAAIERVASRRPRRPRRVRDRSPRRTPVALAGIGVLARNLAGRAPPLPSR